MAETIKLRLDTSKYALPTEDEILAAKQFVLRREDNARTLQERIDEILADAAERIVIICYNYGIDPKKFSISSSYNEQMMGEISDVMDEIEQSILSLIYEYSTRADNDRGHINAVAAWMATLGRGKKNLQETLDDYLFKTMKDFEAAIAALRYNGVKVADAVDKVKANLHSIYTMPEVRKAFERADEFSVTYIRSRGVQYGGVGLSNNGSTNVTNMAKITLQMAWSRIQALQFMEKGAVGYMQIRGSLYNCDVCDDEVGFHPDVNEILTKSMPHPHCQCIRVPIFRIDDVSTKEEE